MTHGNRSHLSEYAQRGFTSLHIKVPTKNRLNLAKAAAFARDGKAITHDELINRLLDHHGTAVIDSAEPARQLA